MDIKLMISGFKIVSPSFYFMTSLIHMQHKQSHFLQTVKTLKSYSCYF